MKVAYNNCYGGFGLSPKALTEFAKRKGISLTWYEQTGYRHQKNEEYKRIDGVPSKAKFDFFALTDDIGEVTNSLQSNKFYNPDFYELRADPDLIDVIETMGEKANGMCADLAIAEIPDGVEFEIEEYDGNESVVPPRMTW